VKDLIDKLLAAIPVYVRQLMELLRDPEGFILKLDLDAEPVLTDAMTFLAVSFGLAFIAQMPLLPGKQDTWVMFGVSAVMAAVGFVFSVALLLLSWRIVGGKLSFRKFLTVTCYFSGVSTLLFLAVTLVAVGAFKSLDPANAQTMFEGGVPDPVELSHSAGFLSFSALLMIGFVLVFVWIFKIWRTYRDLNQVSRGRSAIAFIVYLLLSPLAIGVQMLMGSSLTSGASTPFPAELVGQWEVQQNKQTAEGAVHYAVFYRFDGKGYYLALLTKGTTNGQCYTMISNGNYGHATVKDTTLTLHLQKHTESTTNTCNGEKSEVAKELDNQVFQFALKQTAQGQQLCLSGKFGETCLSPKR